MKTFTEEDVAKIVRAVVVETSNAFLEWLKEETDIVDIGTKQIVPNTEISLKKNARKTMQHYVYPRLVKHGITIVKIGDN